jgi:hypothetical protein
MLMRHAFQGCFTLAMAAAGLAWGCSTLPISEAVDYFGYFENRLLQSETFNPAPLALELASPAAQIVGDCDTHAQTALLLIEMRLAQSALRAGAVQEFDKRVESLDARSKRVLSCAPRQSFVWLLRFSLEAMHGRSNEQSFNSLAMSYEISPNEAWISIRRIVVALPFILVASEPLRQRILSEFKGLVGDGFIDVTVRSYLTSSAPIRLLLQTEIDQLPLPRQKAFSDLLQKLGS